MVFFINIVQVITIHIKLKATPSFTNKTRAFIKKLIAWINPLSNKSFKIFRNTNNLLRVISYKEPRGGFFFYPLLSFFSINT